MYNFKHLFSKILEQFCQQQITNKKYIKTTIFFKDKGFSRLKNQKQSNLNLKIKAIDNRFGLKIYLKFAHQSLLIILILTGQKQKQQTQHPQGLTIQQSLFFNNKAIYNPMQSSQSSNKTFESIIEKLHRKQYIEQSQIKSLCEKAKEILIGEKNLLQIPSPITICGDIHGQFYDLIELFKIGGQPPYVSYLFLGDYVDRGLYSIQTFLLLLTYKVRYKNKFFLIRGNHESRQITQVYGFYDECLRKYGSLNIWKYFTDIFDYLPLAALIDDKILCVHGGLSPNILNLDDIRTLDRKQQIPNVGAMCDLMWSDPDEIQGWLVSPRGAGYLFGQNCVQQFNRANSVSLICRAHQLVMQGYKKIFSKKLVTVWSAPNYCYRCGNVAAILQVDQHCTQYYKVFQASLQEPKATLRRVPQYFL